MQRAFVVRPLPVRDSKTPKVSGADDFTIFDWGIG
jgi:hypothetical protein